MLANSIWKLANRTAPVASVQTNSFRNISRRLSITTIGPVVDNKLWEPPFEILVSQVTQHWRNVAIATPGLWTQIYVPNNGHLDIVAAYLTRSGSLPLDIDVKMSVEDPFICLPPTHSIVEAITPHVTRWRRFSIRVLAPGDIFPCCLIVSAPLLLLFWNLSSLNSPIPSGTNITLICMKTTYRSRKRMTTVTAARVFVKYSLVVLHPSTRSD